MPESYISCEKRVWNRILTELHRRGEERHEAGAFLLGQVRARSRVILDTVFYDELDAAAYDNGTCLVTGKAFAKLWTLCRERKLDVVADVHTHPRGSGQSSIDKANPMIAVPGHVAFIVSSFARQEPTTTIGVFEYLGRSSWRVRTNDRAYFAIA